MTSKKCRCCHKEKDYTEFYNSGKKTIEGVFIKDTLCKVCKKKYKRDRVRGIRDFIRDYKKDLKCSSCGYSKETHENFTPRALEFHHTSNDKDFTIGNAASKGLSIKVIKKEINKCIVLCSRCHAELHSNEEEKTLRR